MGIDIDMIRCRCIHIITYGYSIDRCVYNGIMIDTDKDRMYVYIYILDME